jgi:hypothetical protein
METFSAFGTPEGVGRSARAARPASGWLPAPRRRTGSLPRQSIAGVLPSRTEAPGCPGRPVAACLASGTRRRARPSRSEEDVQPALATRNSPESVRIGNLRRAPLGCAFPSPSPAARPSLDDMTLRREPGADSRGLVRAESAPHRIDILVDVERVRARGGELDGMRDAPVGDAGAYLPSKAARFGRTRGRSARPSSGKRPLTSRIPAPLAAGRSVRFPKARKSVGEPGPSRSTRRCSIALSAASNARVRSMSATSRSRRSLVVASASPSGVRLLTVTGS